jgi:hypothetical protein
MKHLYVLALATFVAGGVAAPAGAYSFSPKDTRFSGTGQVEIFVGSGELVCSLDIAGETTDDGRVKINSAKLRRGELACSKNKLTNLDRAKAVGPGSATMTDITLNGPFVGACGPSAISVGVAANGQWTVTLSPVSGGCSIEGNLATHPAISIVP